MSDEQDQTTSESGDPTRPEPSPDAGETPDAGGEALEAVEAAQDAAGQAASDAAESDAADVTDEDELALAAAMAAVQQATAAASGGKPQSPADGAEAFTPPSFDQPAPGTGAAGLQMLDDVDLTVSIELGRTRMLVEDVLKLSDGAVVELDKLAGDPVDVFVNGRRVARGEVLVLNENFCVRVNEVIDPDQEKGA